MGDYALVGIVLGYSTFRKGPRNLISSAFYLMCYALFKELRAEQLPETRPAPELERAPSRPTGAPTPQQTSAENKTAGGKKNRTRP